MSSGSRDDDSHLKSERVAELFSLCESWIVGQVDGQDFVERSLKLRQALAGASWTIDGTGDDKRLFLSFNHAVHCALAVTQAIEDTKVKAWTANPPVAVRAYHFGQRVSPETILEMESALKID